MDFKKLTEPLAKYRWKIQSYNKSKTWGMAVPFFNARDAENRLDEVCTNGGWQDEYYQVKETLFCKLGIKIDDEWIWKSGAGVEKKSYDGDDAIKLKGEASDAFKLACVKWGIFRDIYSFKSIWMGIKDKKPVDETGKVIKDLTEHINSRLKKPYIKPEKTEAKKADTIKNESKKDNELMSKDVIGWIDESFGNKHISNKTKNIFVADVNKASTSKDLKLVQNKLVLIDLFIEVRPYLEKHLQEHYQNTIMGCTLNNWNGVKDELGKILNGQGD